MAKGKKYTDATKRYDREQLHGPDEALELVKSLSNRNFDETVEVAIRLGVDPRKADQMVRGTVALPSGTGKDVRVAVFAVGDAAREAEAAGAIEHATQGVTINNEAKDEGSNRHCQTMDGEKHTHNRPHARARGVLHCQCDVRRVRHAEPHSDKNVQNKQMPEIRGERKANQCKGTQRSPDHDEGTLVHAVGEPPARRL